MPSPHILRMRLAVEVAAWGSPGMPVASRAPHAGAPLSLACRVCLWQVFLTVFDFPPDASRGLDMPPALVTISQVCPMSNRFTTSGIQ